MLEEYLEYVLRVDPLVKEEDIEEIKEINDWDLLISFKNGRKVIYDRFTNYHRNVFYDNVHELTDEQEKQEFAHRLRTMMKRKYISQEQLAELVGISRAMINRYMNGKALPSVLIVRKIVKVLDCSIDDLFYRDF